MTNLIQFDFEKSDVRVVNNQGNPWFVLRDVLLAMGSKTSVNKAKDSIINGLGKGWSNELPLSTNGGGQTVTVISEAAVTFLIARSNTEAGRRLNQWIHNVVIPSIRKHGGYVQGQEEDDPEEFLGKALLYLKSKYDAKVEENEAQREKLEENLTIDSYRGMYLRRYLNMQQKQFLGKTASYLCRQYGVEKTKEQRVIETKDGKKVSSVGAYPKWILDEAVLIEGLNDD